MVQIGRIMALLRHRELRRCERFECTRFVLMLHIQRYCSNTCKQRAKYARKISTKILVKTGTKPY